MSDFDAAFVRTLAIQSWAAYSFGMLVIFLRMLVLNSTFWSTPANCPGMHECAGLD